MDCSYINAHYLVALSLLNLLISERNKGSLPQMIMKIIKSFQSKKNYVYLVQHKDSQAILKLFSNASHYMKEKTLYYEFKTTPLLIPEVISYNDYHGFLVLEYIRSQNMLDLLENCERCHEVDKAVDLLDQVLDWLMVFHHIPYVKENQLCFHDLNLRNFISIRDTVYGIDFESIECGSFQEDVAKLIGMFLYYNPINSLFKQQVFMSLMPKLLKVTSLSKLNFEKLLHHEINCICQRRKISVNML